MHRRTLALAVAAGLLLSAACSGQERDRETTATATPDPAVTTAPTGPASSPGSTTAGPTTSTVPRATAAPSTSAPAEPEGACRVVDVEDGDTIEVSGCPDAGDVRLLLVDAPETGGDCFSDEAREALAALVLGKSVRLEADARDRDQYGRALRYVWLGDELVNESLARDGFARVAVYESTRYLDRISAAESEARQRSRGLWGACVVGNCDGAVAITGLDKRGEVVTLRGDGVDLTGWSIHSEKGSASGQRFSFPKGFVIRGTVDVVSGATRFEPTPLRLWWTKESIWNNSEDDDAQLFNQQGQLVCEFDDGQ